jgi:signal transduction histidine kinase
MGDEISFPLETRIFHSVCIALIVGVSVNIPIAFYMRIPELAGLLSLVVLVAALLYYLSRFRGLHQTVAVIFQVFVNLALIVNYYFNSGINGPTYTISLLAFMVIVATAPPRQYYVWLPLNIIMIVGLITAEYLLPGWIQVSYKDGESKYIDMVASYLVLAGFAFLITVFTKNAYNYQRQRLIVQSRDLEAANAAKNKLLSILGHDLKQPLASLQAYLELLSDFDLEEKEKKEIQDQLLLVTKNASAMLSNLLAWSRGQMQNLHADIQPLRVLEALAPVTDLAGSISKDKSISLQIDIPEASIVKADRQMLELIVRNLLMNAIKFTPAGGSIWLSVQSTDEACIIRVKDNGVGIAPEIQPYIFSLGIRPGIGTGHEKGTGLGLVLCQEFTQLQGGKLSFESRTGEGATFSLMLPN